MCPPISSYNDGRIDLTDPETPPPKVERSSPLNAVAQRHDSDPATEEDIHSNTMNSKNISGIGQLGSSEKGLNEVTEDRPISTKLELKKSKSPSPSIAEDGAAVSGDEKTDENASETDSEDDSQLASTGGGAENSDDSSEQESEESEIAESDSADLSTNWTCDGPTMATTGLMATYLTPDSTLTGSKLLAEWQRNQRQQRKQLDFLAARIPDPNAPTGTNQQRDADVEDVLCNLSMGSHRAPVVQVKVGPEKANYQVPFIPLAEESLLARRLLQEAPTTVNGQRFVNNNDILLLDVEPGIFDLFVNWLYHDLFLVGNFSNTRVPQECLSGLLLLSIRLQAPALKNAVLKAITDKYLARKRAWSTDFLKGLYCQHADLRSEENQSIKVFALDLVLGNPRVDEATSSLAENPEFLKDYFRRSRENSSLSSASDVLFMEHMKMHHWARHSDSTLVKRDSFDLDEMCRLLFQPIDTSKQLKGAGAKPTSNRPAPTTGLEVCKYCQSTGKAITGKKDCGYCFGTGWTRQQASKAAIIQRRYKEKKKGDELLLPTLDTPRYSQPSFSTTKRGLSQDESTTEAKRLKPMEEYLAREKMRIKQEREDELDEASEAT